MPSPTKNVLAVANFESDVGYAWWMMERFWIQIAEACQDAGSRCHVAYPRIKAIPDTVAGSPLEPFECDFSDRSTAGRIRILEAIEARGVRALYLTDRSFRDPFYASLRRHGVEVVVNHDHTPGDRPPTTGLRGAISSVLNRVRPFTCDLWVAISPLMRQRALLASRVPADRCIVVQNGIDKESPGPDARPQAREALGVGDGDVVVVSVGRAIRYKGLDFSILLAERARDEGLDDVVFVHLGDGPDFEAFRAEAEGRGLLPDRFRFPGRASDVPHLLRGCDLAIHPSHGEGFSLAVLEYMRAGLPVLVPDRPSVSQAIRSGGTGFVYRRDDLDSAMEGLRALATSVETRREMGEAARREMMERYTWERTAREFQRVADYLVGLGARPVP